MEDSITPIRTADEFAQAVSGDPALERPLRVAQEAFTSERIDPLVGAAAIALLFPVARYILTDIGLPWFHSAGRFLELYRLRFDSWVDTQYATHGLDPETAKIAGDTLRRQLEKTTGLDERKSWERLKAALEAGAGG